MDPVFLWIEHSALSIWIRETESVFAFPLIIVLHTLGMGILAGGSWAIDLRLLGVARNVPLAPMTRLFPLFWGALAVNVLSGLLLLTAYPTKAFTNPVFYVKMGCVALGVVLLFKIKHEIARTASPATASRRAKILAGASIASWLGAIAAGRLLAYTYTWLLVGMRGGF